MATVMQTLRETGTSETSRPSPSHFDGLSRVGTVRMILKAEKRERRVARLKAKRPSFMRRLEKVLEVSLMAGIIWVGPKPTPEEAAATLARMNSITNMTNRPAPSPGGPFVSVNSSDSREGPYGAFPTGWYRVYPCVDCSLRFPGLQYGGFYSPSLVPYRNTIGRTILRHDVATPRWDVRPRQR